MNTDYADIAARDELFFTARAQLSDSNFDQGVSNVFDDVLGGSVSLVGELQRMTSELATDYAREGTHIYDLGCSTCNSFFRIDQSLSPGHGVRFVGIDASQKTLNQARDNLQRGNFNRRYQLQCADLADGVSVGGASVVLMALTLEYIRPLSREPLMRLIREGMLDDGCLILVEKVLSDDPTFDPIFARHYEAGKRNGHGATETAGKRASPKHNRLRYALDENRQLLLSAGFKHVEVFFRWYNFCGLIALT